MDSRVWSKRQDLRSCALCFLGSNPSPCKNLFHTAIKLLQIIIRNKQTNQDTVLEKCERLWGVDYVCGCVFKCVY